MMLTQKDEFIYHEMMVHVPMAVHPEVRKVLVIGGGDGGTARELIRYPAIEQIDVVEIDEEVVSACRQYLPQTACGFDDERIHLFYEDGLKYVRRYEDTYDLILVDLRYYKVPMLRFCEENEIDKVLMLYNMETLTEIVIRRSRRRESWSTSMKVRFIQMMRWQCSGRISALWSPFRSARFIRRIFRLIRQGTGCLDLPPSAIIRSQIRTQPAGRRASHAVL